MENGNDRLIKIFKIISFYDNYRWDFFKDDDLINLYDKNIDPDTVILTHWLCYITDRQMPFQRIWDVGGFVFSELITKVKEQKTLNLLKPNCGNSFVKQDSEQKDGKTKYTFISQSTAEKNKTLEEYNDIATNEEVRFKSRFLPSDYYSILCTFSILEEYDFSFSKFIKEVHEKHKTQSDSIRRMLFSLYLLTYYKNKQIKSSEMEMFDHIMEDIGKRKKEVLWLISNEGADEFRDKYAKFQKSEIYKQKRAWCSLRDYLKNPKISGYFKEALKKEDLNDKDFEKISSPVSLAQLELPGDVWNNNSKFRKCILKNTQYENKKYSKWGLNKILRDFYSKNKDNIKAGYPEQFDVSFDFVPRMCESYKNDNCRWCPVYKIDNNINDYKKVCFENTDMFCPIVLAGCNYKCDCKGKSECELVQIGQS